MIENLIDRMYQASLAMGLADGRAMEQIDPTSNPTTALIGTGRATFCGDGSPLSQVAWLGYKTEFNPKELDEVEQFYRGRATSWEYVLNPYCSPALLPGIVGRGWTQVQYENVLALELAQNRPMPKVEGVVRIEAVTPETMAVWSDVSTRAFFGDAVPDSCANLCEVIARAEGSIGFLAYLEDQPAAAATLMVSGQTCYLGGAATLPEFRGRGAQSALLTKRLHHARQLGCDLALCECLPGTPSQRNQQRAGFQVVHTKMVLTKS